MQPFFARESYLETDNWLHVRIATQGQCQIRSQISLVIHLASSRFSEPTVGGAPGMLPNLARPYSNAASPGIHP